MKLSENMLNFLGYAVEQGGFVTRREAVGLAYTLGITSALNNGLIEASTTRFGYVLTERGRELGEIGVRLRSKETASDDKGCQIDRQTYEQRKADLVREGRAKLKGWGL